MDDVQFALALEQRRAQVRSQAALNLFGQDFQLKLAREAYVAELVKSHSDVVVSLPGTELGEAVVPDVMKVGPHGYEHGWKYVGTGDDIADRLRSSHRLTKEQAHDAVTQVRTGGHVNITSPSGEKVSLHQAGTDEHNGLMRFGVAEGHHEGASAHIIAAGKPGKQPGQDLKHDPIANILGAADKYGRTGHFKTDGGKSVTIHARRSKGVTRVNVHTGDPLKGTTFDNPTADDLRAHIASLDD